MDTIKAIPLDGSCVFSPDGKNVVVLEEKNIAVYETSNGRRRGALENIPPYYQSYRKDLLAFSPQGTYSIYFSSLWTLTNLKEHLPKVLVNRDIKAWNSQETVFVTFPITWSQPDMLHIHDALTGQVKHQIDFGHYGNPSNDSFNFSNDGSLLAFIYFPKAYQFYNQTIQDPQRAAIFHLQDKEYKKSATINTARQIVFSPDNDHTLILRLDNRVLVVSNKPRSHTTHEMFACFGHSRDCTIAMNGLQAIISNKTDSREYYTITQACDNFTIAKHTKPENSDEIIRGLTAHLIALKKNTEKSGELEPETLYLERLSNKKHPIKRLLKSKYAAFCKNIQFAGSHDQLLLAPCPVEKILFLFSIPAGKRIAKMPYKELTLSPDTNSFVVEMQGGQKTLYIIPACLDTLAKKSNSYFSLLPTALREYTTNFQPSKPVVTANHENK